MLITLPFFLLILAIAFDIGRIVTIKGQLQTAVDAAALAGALTAETTAEKEITARIENGELIIEEKIKEWKVTIQGDKAVSAAQGMMPYNTFLLPEHAGGFYENCEVDVEVINNNAVLVTAEAKVDTVLLENILKMYGYFIDGISVKVAGTAKAYPE